MSTKIMAFDQTLANCGWVSVLVNEGELYPIESGTIRGQWLDAGMLEPVREAVALRELASAFMVRQNPSLVLVELPPIRRPGMERELSLLACTAVMMAAADHGLTVVGVSAQQAGAPPHRLRQRQEAPGAPGSAGAVAGVQDVADQRTHPGRLGAGMGVVDQWPELTACGPRGRPRPTR